MKTILSCWAALLLPALSVAQEAEEPRPSGQAVVDALDGELGALRSRYGDALKELRASDAYKAADRARQRELSSGITPPDPKPFVERALAAAEQRDGDERLVLYVWAATHTSDREQVEDLVARIEADHVRSPKLVELMENAMALARPLGPKKSAAFLQKVVDESPHNLPRAWAMYWMAQSLTRGRGVSDEDKAKAANLMQQAEKLAEGTLLADKIAGPRFKEERLQIGMIAPEIVGEDLDGVKFKLSDYRGKVVVLDFWGFW